MIYLDYAANTPVEPEVLQEFCNVTNAFIGNPNAIHQCGIEANQRLQESTEKIKELLKIEDMEVIFTSGASESNNMAIKGVATSYKNTGKHIISTCLEHSSVSGSLTYLQSIGYEIQLVDILEDGTVDLEHLKELLRKDTILVSIGYVDSELGVEQPIKAIGNIVKDYPNCFFHVDATQAVGKVELNFENIDLVTFAPHKFYGLNGMGVLLRNHQVILTPLIHGGSSTGIYRSGTPIPAVAATIEKALRLAVDNFEQRRETVQILHDFLIQELKKYPLVRINSPKESSVFFINLSVRGILAVDMQKKLNEHEIYVSTKSACSVPKLPSKAVFAVTKDKKNAKCSFRISLSHLSSLEELQEFMKVFDLIYKESAV